MKNLLITLLIVCSFKQSTIAQITIVQYNVQNFQLKPSDMFAADLINADISTTKVYLIGSIYDKTKKQKVISATTFIIDLSQGITSLSESILKPSYTIHSILKSQYELLPFGNYEICLKVRLVNGIEDIASSCQSIEVTPVSPPLLLSPENGSIIYEELPLFIWLPPMPIIKEKVLYDFKLVEVLNNQTPIDAIQRNFAVFQKADIIGTSVQYPANSIKIDLGKKYSWKVVAKTEDNLLIGETEVWWFQKSDPNSEIPIKGVSIPLMSYIQLKQEISSDFVFASKEVRVVINGNNEPKSIKFQLKDTNGKIVGVFNEGSYHYDGQNRYTLLLDSEFNLKQNKFYILESINTINNEYQYLVIKYVKEN